MTNSFRIRIRNTAILLASMMTIMAGATISPALPEIHQAFASAEEAELMVKLILTLPALFIALFAPISGFLLDRLGRRPVLLVSTLLYGVAGCSGLYLDSLEGILAGRALLGVAVAGIMSGCTAWIADHFQANRLAKFMGKQSAFMSYGGVAFLLLGGVLADVGWHMPFAVYGFAFLVLPLLYLYVHDVPRETSINDEGKKPSLPWRNLVGIYASAFIVMALFYLIPVHFAFYANEMEEISAARIGLFMACSTLATAIASSLYHHISRRLASSVIFILLYVLMATGFLIMAWATNSFVAMLGIVLVGTGFGLWVPNTNVWLVSVVPSELRGKAAGGFTMCFFGGQFFTPFLSQPLAQNFGVASSFVAASIILILLAVWFLKKSQNRL